MKAVRSVALLVALALAGGNATGCDDGARPPASGAPAAATAQGAASADEGKLCEHRVPAALCTRCNPDLADVFREQGDWCAEHGVPESQCFECNPGLRFDDVAAAPADWCREHSIPESKCTKCNPELVSSFIEAGNYCRVHGFPQDACPFCHPELVRAAGQVPPAEQQLTSRVRLASAGTAPEAGIQTRKVEKRRVSRTLDVVGQLAFDRNKVAALAARGEARIVEVHADLGDEVGAGQPLVVLVSASIGEEQAQLSSARTRIAAARANLERETRLAQKGISTRRSVEEAQAELARAQAEQDAARSSLGAAGVSTVEAGGRHVLSSPFGGTVVSRDAVVGRSVEDGHVLIEVADLSVFWALLDVPESDAGKVRPGQKVSLSLEGTGQDAIAATVTRVASSVDPATRTVQVRVELPNPERRLKAGTFVRATVEVGDEHEALLLPREAVQKAEGRSIVFVKKEANLFQPVTVKVEEAGGGQVEVTSGLSEGDEVVTTGAFLLKTEILKDSIGAGCCEEGE